MLLVLKGSANDAEADKAERSGYYPWAPHEIPSIDFENL
jgi:hypothetical protein